MNRTSRKITALTTVALGLGMSQVAQAQIAYTLSANGDSLLSFNLATPGTVNTVGLFSGAATSITDIDFRPATGVLYGYDQSRNQVVTINTATGVTTFASTPATASTTSATGIDFNPVPDRLRVVNFNDQNLRINVADGATIVDGTLTYAVGDPNAGVNPALRDAAYTNSDTDPGTGTTLYYIDTNLNTLVSTTNPNAGTLNTIGALGADPSDTFGFDILTVGGVNSAYAIIDSPGISGAGLYSVNLGTGAASLVGDFGTFVGGLAIAPVTSAPVPEPSSVALLVGLTTIGASFLRMRRVRK